MRPEAREVHDAAIKEMRRRLVLYNPCQIENGTCERTRSGAIPKWVDDPQELCCGGCPYWQAEVGCAVPDRTLECKLWFCRHLRETAGPRAARVIRFADEVLDALFNCSTPMFLYQIRTVRRG